MARTRRGCKARCAHRDQPSPNPDPNADLPATAWSELHAKRNRALYPDQCDPTLRLLRGSTACLLHCVTELGQEASSRDFSLLRTMFWDSKPVHFSAFIPLFEALFTQSGPIYSIRVFIIGLLLTSTAWQMAQAYHIARRTPSISRKNYVTLASTCFIFIVFGLLVLWSSYRL